MPSEKFLKGCAWAVHLYTALGAVAGLLALDSSDGPLARKVRIRERIPMLDGALLDNVVDYLTYVAAPVFLMLRAGIVPRGAVGLALAAFLMVASAYGFCRTDAKTEDNYFRGFPSYWNLVALYLFCLGFQPMVNAAVLALLGVMVFVLHAHPARVAARRTLRAANGRRIS